MTKDPNRVLGGKIGSLRRDFRKTKQGFAVSTVFLLLISLLAWGTDSWTSYSILSVCGIAVFSILIELYGFVMIRNKLTKYEEEKNQMQNK